MPRVRRIPITIAVALIGLAAARLEAATAPIRIELDAREAPRRLLHARLAFPVKPGPLTLLYPKWIPGEHGPSGPVMNLAGLHFKAGGREIPWRRDQAEMHTFHLEVPAGTAGLEATLDYLIPAGGDRSSRFSSSASASARLAVVSWNHVLLYPRGARASELMYDASIRLPSGWKHGTAMAARREEAGRVDFRTVSLETLVDSPLLAGEFLRTIDLSPGASPPHQLVIAADSAAALEMSDVHVEQHRRLVKEALALFGGHHYGSYTFLLTLSDHVTHFGLEHHESSDNRVPERTLIDDAMRRNHAGLLPHELVHSWNGKYRRPAAIATPDYQEPMKTDLLWAYEGLTSYLGGVLAARSGMRTVEDHRDDLALLAANYQRQAGRQWRPLTDTAVAAQLLFYAPENWRSLRRHTDFYGEGVLTWLEADALIRQKSGGKKSLDDFCRLFFGAPNGPPSVKTYTFDDLAEALNSVAPHDWRAFFDERVNRAGARPPLGGLEMAGWPLSYTDTVTPLLKSREEENKTTDAAASLGLLLGEGGEIADVIPGLPADLAGIAPAMKVVAVNGRRYTPKILRAALRSGAGGKEPLSLLVENEDYFTTFPIDYKGGERYPTLKRDPSKPDLLGEIVRPLVSGRP
jgi:predicted metalloprotease with PDZ domain